MRLRRLKIFFYRRKLLLSKHFFDNVYIKDKETKNNILYWMCQLKNYRNISIDKFKYLFCKYKEIVFPIEITSISRTHFKVEDSMGEEYYLICMPYSYSEMNNYVVGIRSNFYDRDCRYCITSENEIVLRERSILPLNQDCTNKDYSITFYYNSKFSTTTATLDTPKSTIEVSYPSQVYMNEDRISKMLFDVAESNQKVEDVFLIFDLLYKTDKCFVYTTSLVIKSMDKEGILSEIILSNGIVEKYIFTETISEYEICVHKQFASKKIEEFVSSKYECRNK